MSTDILLHYLDDTRQAILWKLEGLSEYDLRRPLTPTGSNIIGIVKHLASVELGYFGEVFDRPSGIPLPWFDDDAPVNADMWLTADESSADIVDLLRRAGEHTRAVVEELGPDGEGVVPWWPAERARVTITRALIHSLAEMNRHAGHIDILREQIDGAAGLTASRPNVPDELSADEWAAYVDGVRQAAQAHQTTDVG